ncbi:hypothetical protein ACKF11_12935 [Methylobacillus sp. Pita2]|uniref:hypothetical protein n=1 Tax=Methylobacillus sp. Pita2 TaxID=3383245 RepID=UPI0038B4C9A6
MLRLFFDFEFDPVLDTPISFGMVGGTDASISFYREFKAPAAGYKSEFVYDTVLPLLTKDPSERTSPGILGGEITQFILDLCEANNTRPADVILTCDSIEDVQYLEQFSGAVFKVECISFTSFDEENMYSDMYASEFDPITFPRHNALNDAVAMKNAFEALATQRSLNPPQKRHSPSFRLAA